MADVISQHASIMNIYLVNPLKRSSTGGGLKGAQNKIIPQIFQFKGLQNRPTNMSNHCGPHNNKVCRGEKVGPKIQGE